MQFAVKKLTMSDLTFFEYQFRRFQNEARAIGEQGSKQKAINLNADVFVDMIFPLARGNGEKRRFNLPVAIYGPGLRRQPQVLTRKVISAGGGGKNWRLNGELVPDPEFDPTRYHDLKPGDLALFGLEGDGIPTGMSLVLVSHTNADDASIYSALMNHLGNRKMDVIDAEILASVVAASALDHPIRELLDSDLDDALEEAALGSAEGQRRLRSRGSPRRMSAEALQEARARAEAIGRAGEVLMDAWLREQVKNGKLNSSTWISESNAVNAWDFDAEETDGTLTRLEVKSTGKGFDHPLHISHAEIESAADPAAPRTDLYRVYGLSNGTASLRIARDIREFARTILSAVAGLGNGITPDSYSIAPERIGDWSPPVTISIPDDEEE
ncbi:hypothetical protein AB4072_08810 [Microvirga sp. 2MCAF38]|uniref:hypothetical protein n=1 Tax=Microvirga sp. 2MCAF38 TaxID=3232989 RepID=UPI003F979615